MVTDTPLYLLNIFDEKLALSVRENSPAKNGITPPKKGQDYGYPSNSIILSRENKRAFAEGASNKSKKPIFVANHRIVRSLMAEPNGNLLSPKQIERLLEVVEEPKGKVDVDREESV